MVHFCMVHFCMRCGSDFGPTGISVWCIIACVCSRLGACAAIHLPCSSLTGFLPWTMLRLVDSCIIACVCSRPCINPRAVSQAISARASLGINPRAVSQAISARVNLLIILCSSISLNSLIAGMFCTAKASGDFFALRVWSPQFSAWQCPWSLC